MCVCVCVSHFCTGAGGGCVQQMQANVQGHMKQNVGSGAQSEALRHSWKGGASRTQDQKTRTVSTS